MQVRSTNDSSIVSKLSAANKGYFEDKWLKIFVEKEQNRSPIINRGYYIRYKAIEAAFNAWFTIASQYKKTQIVSLGAGFDSSYFRLKKTNKLPLGCKYIEVDYPEVMMRKLQCIKKSEFKNILDSCNKQANKNSNIVAVSEDYIMLGVDLIDCKRLEECFKSLEVDFDVPTFFLSECALTYMSPKSSNDLIQWIQAHFPNSALTVYEQVDEEDGFSIVMKKHFETLGCSLKSLKRHISEYNQCSRYFDMGWRLCSSITMLNFFMGFPEIEKDRIQFLELFDEFEMWHEKCRHYCLIWACQGVVSLPEMFLNQIPTYSNMVFDHIKLESLKTICQPTPDLLQRYGHQVALLSSRFLIVSGGFGQLEKKHQRLGGLTCYDTVTKNCYLISPSNAQDLLGKRMFHTMTKLSSGIIVVIGGRSSPSSAFSTVVSINCDNILQNLGHKCQFSSEKVSVMPLATWRHSANVIDVNGFESIFIFGGCAVDSVVTDHCYILDIESWHFSKLPHQEHTPSPRHSHSAVCIDMNKIYVTGGLSKDERILNSVHVFNVETYTWSTLNVAGLIPRYSHTSHYYNNAIFLVGGICGLSYISHFVGMIDLSTGTAFEYQFGVTDPENPLILSNHCCYIHENQMVLTGGGGNCFSFGTHFNKLDIVVQFPDSSTSDYLNALGNI